MDQKFVERVLQLQHNDRIKINGRLFVIQEKAIYPAPNQHDAETTRFELGDNYVLECNGSTPFFFELIEKKYLFGFTSTRSRIEKIETFEIIVD